MSPDITRLLRILAVVSFVIALAAVFLGNGPTEYARAVYAGLLAGLALFALSFAT